jgi:type III pantothenate kinase
MYGSVEMVDVLIRRIKAELGVPLNVIATGGLASVLFKESTEINVIEPFLTLDGLRMIYAQVKKS